MSEELAAAYRRIEQLEAALARRTELLDRRQAEFEIVKSSQAYRFAHGTRKAVDRFFPLTSRRRAWLKNFVHAGVTPVRWAWRKRKAKDGPPPEARHQLETIPQAEYDRWRTRFEPSAADFVKQRQHRFSKSPKVSLVVPVFNPPGEFLTAMIESVRNQTYANWELCLADASTAPHVKPILDAVNEARIESRIPD